MKPRWMRQKDWLACAGDPRDFASENNLLVRGEYIIDLLHAKSAWRKRLRNVDYEAEYQCGMGRPSRLYRAADLEEEAHAENAASRRSSSHRDLGLVQGT